MISFQDPQLTDRRWVEELFRASGNRGCEYSFVTLYIWSQTFEQKIARMEGYALERLRGSMGFAYLFPAGSGLLEPVLSALEADAAEREETCRFVCMTVEQVQTLERLRPGVYQVEPDRDGWDYLYDIDRMADLPGKRLHGKRNHSHIGGDTFDLHFEKAYGELQGAYPMIYREFARWLRDHVPGLRWLNREDDMGMPGLRKSKESYHPDRMVEKYAAVRRSI